jgi:AraC-like DNA-binding protein
MLTYGLPLTGFETFRAESPNQLTAAVEAIGARVIRLPPAPGLSAVGNSVKLPNGELWFCSYGTPLQLSFRESDYLRLQLPVKGAGRTSYGRHSVEVTGTQCCVSSAAAVIEFGADYQQIAWRVRRDALIRKLNARLDRPVTRCLEFQPILRLDNPAGNGLMHLLHCMLQVFAVGNESMSLIVAEMEQALMAGLLFAADHNLRSALEERPSQASPAHVRRAEDFIVANLHRPLSIDEVAAAVNVSVRSLYRSFRAHRGYAPMEFLKQSRLAQARRLLAEPHPNRSVTSVAMSCGFGDLSHFSKNFFSAFGELPSAVARRSRKLR